MLDDLSNERSARRGGCSFCYATRIWAARNQWQKKGFIDLQKGRWPKTSCFFPGSPGPWQAKQDNSLVPSLRRSLPLRWGLKVWWIPEERKCPLCTLGFQQQMFFHFKSFLFQKSSFLRVFMKEPFTCSMDLHSKNRPTI